MDGNIERSGDQRRALVRSISVVVAIACIGAAVLLGDHGQRIAGGALMALALVAVITAHVVLAASER